MVLFVVKWDILPQSIDGYTKWAKERGRNNFPNSSKNWFYLRVSFERQSVY